MYSEMSGNIRRVCKFSPGPAVGYYHNVRVIMQVLSRVVVYDNVRVIM